MTSLGTTNTLALSLLRLKFVSHNAAFSEVLLLSVSYLVQNTPLLQNHLIPFQLQRTALLLLAADSCEKGSVPCVSQKGKFLQPPKIGQKN